MSESSVRVPRSARRRVAGGGTLGLALAVVGTTATPAHAQDYTVRPGDTVSHIALRTSTTVQAIRQANALDPRASIRVGQTLTIPTRGGSGATTAAAPSAPAPAATSHRVTAGETVSALAARYGTTTTAIVQVNGLDARALIRIGQTLTIPTPGTSGTAGSSSPAAPTAAAPVATSHRVTAGETVSALAVRYGTTTSAIVRANGLDARAFIRIGQTLTIPTAGTAGTEATAGTGGTSGTPGSAAPTAPAPATASHRVTAGETVSALAVRYGTTTSAIVQANALDARALIRIGQTLTIPTPGTPGTSGTSGTAGTGAAAATAPTSGLVGDTFAGRTYPAATVASANQNKAALLATAVPTRAQMQALVASTARQMGVDPALAQAVAFQESGFNHASVSPANAIGTMQVIPTSGEWASGMVGRQLNLLDPQDNVVAGVAILRQLLRSAPDTPTAIAGYYQGLAGVRAHGMYPDTRRYVANVQTLMNRFA